MDSIGWKESLGLLVIICGVILAIDIYFETHYIGATARFLWNSLAFVMQSLARTIEASLALLFRQRAKRILTGIFTTVGFVYVSHLILTDKQVRSAHTWREWIRLTIRVALSHVRDQWLRLPLWGKLLVVGIAIYGQVHFIPWMAAFIVLFPIAFLVPIVRSIKQWLVSFFAPIIVDSVFGQWYWRRYGVAHRATITKLKTIPGGREIRGLLALIRLQYLTAWRMWKYAPCYQLAKSERRRISLFEPLRLWWCGELNRYVQRPLLSGPRNWPATTYSPPTLWYEHESPQTQIVRKVLMAVSMFCIMFGLRSSARRP